MPCANSSVAEQRRGPRELHLGKRFGGRGPGTSGLPRYGPYKASAEDVARRARRAFTAANAALVLLAEEPFELPFRLGPGGGDPPASARALDAVVLPAGASGPPGGVSASVELPCTLAGRLAFQLLLSRLEAAGTPGDLSAAVEQIAAGELIGLLGSRHASREQIVDRLWELEPADIALAAGLMSATLLLLLPPGVAIDELETMPAPSPRPRVRGRRHRVSARRSTGRLGAAACCSSATRACRTSSAAGRS